MSNISLENRIHDALPEKGETSSWTEQNDLAFTGAVTSFGNYQDTGHQGGHSSGQQKDQDGGADHGAGANSQNTSASNAGTETHKATAASTAMAMEVLGFPISTMGRHVFAMKSSLQNEADLINEISANEDESTGFASASATGTTFHYPVIAKQLGPDSIKSPKKP